MLYFSNHPLISYPFSIYSFFFPYSLLGQCPENKNGKQREKMLLIFYTRMRVADNSSRIFLFFLPSAISFLTSRCIFYVPFLALTLAKSPDFPFFIDFFCVFIPCGIFFFSLLLWNANWGRKFCSWREKSSAIAMETRRVFEGVGEGWKIINRKNVEKFEMIFKSFWWFWNVSKF